MAVQLETRKIEPAPAPETARRPRRIIVSAFTVAALALAGFGLANTVGDDGLTAGQQATAARYEALADFYATPAGQQAVIDRMTGLARHYHMSEFTPAQRAWSLRMTGLAEYYSTFGPTPSSEVSR